MTPRRLLVLTAPVALASLAAIAFVLASPGAASTSQSFPARNASGHLNCSVEPSRPVQTGGSVYGGRSGGGFPIVGSIDANGCDSWTYEHAGSFGPYTSFFAGSGFQPGQHAYQDSTQETTELLDGHQLIRVVDPTQQWLRVYRGYDVCTTGTGPNGSTITCIAPAPESLPSDWVIYIPVAILLGLMALFLIHFLRPAGPVRRPRHYRRVHQDLTHATRATPRPSSRASISGNCRSACVDWNELRAPSSRSPNATGSAGSLHRAGTAWPWSPRRVGWPSPTLRSRTTHGRRRSGSPARSRSSEVRPVLDAQVFAHREDDGPRPGPTTGFDVPLDDFKQLVSEAVDSLPPAFGKAMTNVAIVVQEEHDPADRFGQYQGHPLAVPRYRTWLLHPDKITIYRKTICEHCHSRDEVTAMVYRVVVHEIAHHFGIDDPRLRELGW